jgi:uncharacterized protein YjbI with pentapeptide repeats
MATKSKGKGRNVAEGLDLDGRVRDGNFRNADFTGAYWPGGVAERCDFTGARLVGLCAQGLVAREVVFAKADLQRAVLPWGRLAGVDFRAANLAEVDFVEADLTGTTLARADLRGATLVRARLRGADLRNANLRGASLYQADLTDARIDGADFRGANLVGAKVVGLDLARAKGLSLEATKGGGAVGAKVRELEGVLRKAATLRTTAALDGECGLMILMMHGTPSALDAHLKLPRTTVPRRGRSLRGIMRELGRLSAHGTLRPDSVTARASKSPLSPQKLKKLALEAWCEVCGVAPASPEELAEKVKAGKVDSAARGERMLADLRGGAEGVARWNARPEQERQQFGPYENADLTGADLRGADLGWVSFEGSCFDRADLRGAKLGNWGRYGQASFRGAICDGIDFNQAWCEEADFTVASLRRATAYLPDFRKVSFRGADLRDADLRGADLRGADLCSASVDGAHFLGSKYDEHTRWPVGFAQYKELRWAGKGPKPR